MTLLLIIVCSMVALGLTVTAALSRLQKLRLQDLQVIGSTGMVNSTLNSQGTVLVKGEVWRACTSHGGTIAVGARIEVVGARQHLLVVREC